VSLLTNQHRPTRTKKIDIVLPVYNEGAILELFAERLYSVLESLSHRYRFEVIFVVDRSSDNTEQVLARICAHYANARAIFLSRRFGHQMSLVAGMDYSDGDAAIMMDCDLQHPPEVIPQLLERYEAGYDVVHTIRKYTERIGLLTRLTSSLFYKFLRLMSDVEISEDAADFRLISQRVLHVFQAKIREQNQFLRGLFHWVGFNQCFVHFDAGRREKGISKYNLKRRMRFAATGIVSFSKTPLRWSITLGFLVSACSFLYAIHLAVGYLFSNELPPGWATLAVAVFFFMGIQSVFTGILGEYIGALFDEVKSRPLYVVERVMGSPRHTDLSESGVLAGEEERAGSLVRAE